MSKLDSTLAASDSLAIQPQPADVLSSSTAQRWTLRVVDNEEGFQALQPHWDRLLARSAVRTPFMTWDWCSVWWSLHSHQCRLRIGVVDDSLKGEPLAIAPMIIGRQPVGTRWVMRHLTFLGCLGEDGSQGMDFIVPQGLEPLLTPLLCELFSRVQLHWDAIDLPSMHEESPNLPFIKIALESFLGHGERFAPQQSFMLSLPKTWDEQLALWKSKDRVLFRSKWKKLMEEHQGRALISGVEMPPDVAFDELWRVHGLRFQDEKSVFLNASMEQLHREILRRWAMDGRALITLIEADGKVVAARYGLVFDGKYWCYQAGFDPAYAKLCVGRLVLGWTAQHLMALDVLLMDHLPGDQRYKQEWSTHTRRVVHLEAFNWMSLTAAMFRMLRAFRRRTASTSEIMVEEVAT
jgi:CelD/BcsL family acetyltransferase involved in cellulose biosynthesis